MRAPRQQRQREGERTVCMPRAGAARPPPSACASGAADPDCWMRSVRTAHANGGTDCKRSASSNGLLRKTLTLLTLVLASGSAAATALVLALLAARLAVGLAALLKSLLMVAQCCPVRPPKPTTVQPSTKFLSAAPAAFLNLPISFSMALNLVSRNTTQ